MSPRKCVFGCEGGLTLFIFPKDAATKNQWMRFVFPSQQQKGVSANIFVCSRHFSEDSFANKAQYDAGYADRLKLKVGAVPTLHGREATQAASEASTSGQATTSHATARFKHTGCQTEPIHMADAEVQVCVQKQSKGMQYRSTTPTASVATQLSHGTLRTARSKHTHTSCAVATEMDEESWMQLSSAPIKASTSELVPSPAKRAHMELVKEEEEEEDVSFPNIPVPHDSTYEPGDSVTEPSEVSGTEASTDYSDTKYIIFESSLGELFKSCPVCRAVTEVRQIRRIPAEPEGGEFF